MPVISIIIGAKSIILKIRRRETGRNGHRIATVKSKDRQ